MNIIFVNCYFGTNPMQILCREKKRPSQNYMCMYSNPCMNKQYYVYVIYISI